MLDGPDEDGGSVLSEQSPYEPDEFDPSSLGPDVPEAPDAPEGAANSDVTALFWKLVVVFNVALLALSVGPMLAYFEGQVDLGLRLFAVGVILFGYGTFRYLQFVRDRDDDAEPADADGTDDAEMADADKTDDAETADDATGPASATEAADKTDDAGTTDADATTGDTADRNG